MKGDLVSPFALLCLVKARLQLTGASTSDPLAVAPVGVTTDFGLNGKSARACSAKKVESRSTKNMKSSRGVFLSRNIV